ncbi:MAG: hypothetical protein V4581_07760, partial [Bacteroidota bacterium]
FERQESSVRPDPPSVIDHVVITENDELENINSSFTDGQTSFSSTRGTSKHDDEEMMPTTILTNGRLPAWAVAITKLKT